MKEIEKLILDALRVFNEQHPYEAGDSAYRKLLEPFLEEHGIELRSDQKLGIMIKETPDSRRTLTIIIANKTFEEYPDLADYYQDSIWYDVDPAKEIIEVERLPVDVKHDENSKRIFEPMPSIQLQERYRREYTD